MVHLKYPQGGIYCTRMEKERTYKSCHECSSSTVLRTNTESHALRRRLAIVEGQVRGLSEMVGRGDYCIDIITQASAIKQALSNIEDILLEEHLGKCVVEQMASGQSDKVSRVRLSRSIDSSVNSIRLFRHPEVRRMCNEERLRACEHKRQITMQGSRIRKLYIRIHKKYKHISCMSTTPTTLAIALIIVSSIIGHMIGYS
jgi:DNA-binding FrmR family transcriptional regulator